MKKNMVREKKQNMVECTGKRNSEGTDERKPSNDNIFEIDSVDKANSIRNPRICSADLLSSW